MVRDVCRKKKPWKMWEFFPSWGPSPQDLEAEASYVLSIISPWCISHCHMALSLIFEVKHIITQLANGKMWRYHILPIQIL